MVNADESGMSNMAPSHLIHLSKPDHNTYTHYAQPVSTCVGASARSADHASKCTVTCTMMCEKCLNTKELGVNENVGTMRSQQLAVTLALGRQLTP